MYKSEKTAAGHPGNPGNPGSRRSTWKEFTDPPYYYCRCNWCKVQMANHSTWSREPPIHLRLRAGLTCRVYQLKMTVSHSKTPLSYRFTVPAIHSKVQGHCQRTRSKIVTLSLIPKTYDFATRSWFQKNIKFRNTKKCWNFLAELTG